MERVVLCMKWGTLYGPRYVNVLYRAVRDHLDGPFRFVCLTDDATGLDDGIETFPFEDLETASEAHRPGIWPKLGIYRKDLFGLKGRALFLDLDTVVVGQLDPFFELSGDFRGMTDVRRSKRTDGASRLNTSVFSFDIGAQTQILDAYLSDKDRAHREFPNDQSFTEAHARNLEFWPEGWVISFKRHLRRGIGADLFLPPRAPGDARIVAFHGDPRPIDLVGRKGLWADPPHFVRCPVPWLDAYWERYGA